MVLVRVHGGGACSGAAGSAQRQPTAVAPREETRAAPRIGTPGVRVADVGGEEFDVAPGGLVAELGDERGHSIGVGLGREAGGWDDGWKPVGGANSSRVLRTSFKTIREEKHRASIEIWLTG